MANGRLAWDFKGLVTAPGLLARPGASCLVADNVRFPAPGIMRKREGFEIARTLGTGIVSRVVVSPALGTNYVLCVGSATVSGLSTVFLVQTLVGGATSYTYSAEDFAAGQLTAFANPSAVSFGRNVYVLLERGSIVRREYNFYRYGLLQPYAGMPKGTAPLVYSMNAATFSVLTAGTLLAANASRAYRVTWHVKTSTPASGPEESIELGGPPTARLTIRNIAGTSGYTGAAMDVALRIPLPSLGDYANTNVTTDWFYRLWGSRIEASATASPNDEMHLIQEAFVTATDITNGYASFTDNTPDVFLVGQSTLNTNTTNFPPLEAGLQNGHTNADERPPAGYCIAGFASCLFVGSPIFRPEVTHRLVSLPAAGETFTVYGNLTTVTLTAVAGAPAAANQFTVVTTLATTALNLEATARNIADAVSLSARTPQACYVSLGSDIPGSIRFTDGGGTFWIYSSSATTRARFSPQLGSSTSEPGVRPTLQGNVLSFSKANRPDSFPVVNILTIGASSNIIRALLPFRERLLVFTDEGLYAVDGSTYADFVVTPVDLTAKILGPRSAVALEDKAFAWCVDGIIEYRDGAIRRISETIAPTIRNILELQAGDGLTFEGVRAGFAAADPKHHEVHFWYATKAQGAVGPRNWKWLCWNTQTECWSTGSRVADSIDNWVADGVAMLDSGRMTLLSARESYIYGVQSNDPALLAQSIGHFAGTPQATNYADDRHSTGGEDAVVATVRLQWALADADLRPHWQRTVFEFESGEQSFLTKPTALSLVWSADAQGSDSSAISLAPTNPLAEVEVPDGYRRATRSRFLLTHSAKEPMGLIAVKQTFSDGTSRFPG
jgi:hypothetical protein